METGIRGCAETVVSETNTASAAGSGLLDVFSTPAMIALMEMAACESVQPYLEEGQGTVGIRMEADHLAATPVGEKVWAESELTEVNNRILTFTISAYSEKEKIGQAVHRRCIINNERFLKKMNEKYGG